MCMSPQDSVNPRKGIPRSNADSRPHERTGTISIAGSRRTLRCSGSRKSFAEPSRFWSRFRFAKTEPTGLGRIEFSFNVVFWLILIVRDCFKRSSLAKS